MEFNKGKEEVWRGQMEIIKVLKPEAHAERRFYPTDIRGQSFLNDILLPNEQERNVGMRTGWRGKNSYI